MNSGRVHRNNESRARQTLRRRLDFGIIVGSTEPVWLDRRAVLSTWIPHSISSLPAVYCPPCCEQFEELRCGGRLTHCRAVNSDDRGGTMNPWPGLPSRRTRGKN